MTPPPSKPNDFYAGYNPKFEALQEISNIGVGHAATALSQLLRRRVDMSIPRINLIEINEVSTHLASGPEEIVAGIYVQTQEEEDSFLNLLLVLDLKSITYLLSILRDVRSDLNLFQLDEISTSIIKETGNILLLHTISAINSFTSSQWFPKTPHLAIDMIKALTEEALVNGVEEHENGKLYVLLVECDVFTQDGNQLKGDIILLPNRIAANILMTRLYGEGWEET